MRWINVAVIAVVGMACMSALTWAADPQDANLDWPHWRGPKSDNLPVIKSMVDDFSKLHKAWEVKGLIAGKNADTWASVVIVGDKLLTMGRENTKDTLVCLNSKTGEPVWKQSYDATGQDVQYGNGPRATPTVDGDKVYTFGCFGQVACWQLADGKQVWMKNVMDLGGKRPMWGFASTPLVSGNNVIVQSGGKAIAVALDKKTGAQVWAGPAGDAGYAAPMIANVGNKPVLVVFAATSIVGLDPDKGTQLWSTPWNTSFGMNCATPIQIGQRLLVGSSNFGEKTGGAGLFELSDRGLKLVWSSLKFGPGHNDPVVIDGLLYAYSGFSMDDKGTLICADFETGAIKWAAKEAGGPGTVLQVGKRLL
jgi:outer membrane protein assembly factor BamB